MTALERTVVADPIGHVVIIPIKTVSESNARDHWSKRAARAKAHRTVVGLRLRALLADGPGDACVVTIIRIAPRELDDDNLRGATKNVRDGVADALGLANDRDPRVTWRYGQRKGRPRQFAIEIRVER